MSVSRVGKAAEVRHCSWPLQVRCTHISHRSVEEIALLVYLFHEFKVGLSQPLHVDGYVKTMWMMLWLNVQPGFGSRCSGREICLFVMNHAVSGHRCWMMRTLRTRHQSNIWCSCRTLPSVGWNSQNSPAAHRECVNVEQMGTLNTVGINNK